jgi:hypothetical protein
VHTRLYEASTRAYVPSPPYMAPCLLCKCMVLTCLHAFML